MTVIIDPDREMYRRRKLNAEQRAELLAERKRQHRPWHSPPHYVSDSQTYLLTAACFEHQPVIGSSPERMAYFEKELLEAVTPFAEEIFAWVVLPNHYHVLVRTRHLKELLHSLRLLHGRTAHEWNGDENRRGRQVWCKAVETGMKSERHFWATLNYVLHNAVRHRYVQKWQDWPYSNAAEYLEQVGREVAETRWREYPLLNYGDEWDPPEL